ncbi:UNVERIFIED_CONTAM: hypothetical protein NCL1_44434 [Trichonephila clavipes]
MSISFHLSKNFKKERIVAKLILNPKSLEKAFCFYYCKKRFVNNCFSKIFFIKSNFNFKYSKLYLNVHPFLYINILLHTFIIIILKHTILFININPFPYKFFEKNCKKSSHFSILLLNTVKQNICKDIKF